jgi:hypothetical protein
MGSALKYWMAVFEIYSEAGTLQATGTQGVSFALASTGNVTLVDDGQTHPQPLVAASITVTATNPVLAYNAPVHTNVIYQSSSGSTHTFWLRARSNSPVGVQYWIFDTAQGSMIDSTMTGIEFALWDELGVKTFDAKTAMLRVATTHETTMPQDGDVPFGNNPGGVGTNVAQIAVPAGRTYAVIQSTGAFINTMYDTGSYSNSSNPPSQVVVRPDDPDGSGPSSNWRYQNLESYHSSALNNGNTITVGMTQFERWSGWYPRGSTPHFNVNGQARHTIIDVTGYVSSGPVNPGTVTVNVNATSRSVSTGGAAVISYSTTPSVTASASGGTAPYAYSWQRTIGSELIEANGSVTSAAFSTGTANQAQDTTRDANWRCRVTDAAGRVGYSPEVTFTHVAQAFSQSVTPTPVGTLAAITPSTASHIAYGTPRDFRITGITQAITLRVTKATTSNSGSLVKKYLYVAISNDGTNFTNLATLANDNQSYDFSVSNGQYVRLSIEVETSSGMARTQWNVTVSNVTGGGTVTTMAVDATVDNDNNYNVVQNQPAPLTLQNITINTNDHTGNGGTDTGLTGFNQNITLRVERYAFSGFLDSAVVNVYRGPVHNQWGPWTFIGGFYPQNSGLQYIDVPVSPGQRLHYTVAAATNGGRQQGSWEMAVWNLTRGERISTTQVSVTVDADNNYNVPTYTANAMSFSGLNTYAFEHSAPAYIGSTAQTLSGPNRAVQMRVHMNYNYVYTQAKNQWGDGQPDNWTNTSSSGALQVIINGTYRAQCAHNNISGTGANGATGYATCDFTMNPGDTIQLYLDHRDPMRLGDGHGGTISHLAGNIAVDNLSSGQRLANFNHNNLARGPDLMRNTGPGPGDPGGPGDPWDPGGPIVITP